MEKTMGNDMETGGASGFKGLDLSYYIGEILLFITYIYMPSRVTEFKFPNSNPGFGP